VSLESTDLQARRRFTPSLDHLQQSPDAIAVEVERIGEGQRFINKLQQDKVDAKR
jgi:hypothetical protein